VASIQIYFEGAKYFPSQGGGRSTRPESRGGVLGRSSKPPAHQLGGVGSTVSSLSGVWDRGPENLKFAAP